MWPRLALVIAVFSCRDHEAAPNAGSGSAPPPVTQRTGTGPTLPTIDAAPAIDAVPPPRFADEPRDDAWARPLEAELRDVKAASIKKIAAECHTTQCKLTVQPNPGAELAAANAVEAALRGEAVNITLDSNANGELVVYATFAR
jgi:hypothetical protein